LGAIGALTVENSGSIYRTTDHMIVGFLGSGTMTVRDEGLVDIDPADTGVTVEAGRAFLGYEAGAQGVVHVVGPGSVWQMTSHLYVGWEGAGTLNIIDGGKVDSFRGRIARFDNSVGVVNVIGNGSLWQLDPVDGNLAIGHAASTHGTLNLLDGGSVFAWPRRRLGP
jgi:T5SS/PEP-CTERM-associated repeat protein